MPINLDTQFSQMSQTGQQNSKSVFLPTFFNTQVQLTGRGKANGLLSENRNPRHTGPTVHTLRQNIDPWRSSVKNDTTQIHYIPLFAMSSDTWRYIEHIEAFDDLRTCEFAKSPLQDTVYKLRVTAHSITADRKDPEVRKDGTRITHPTNIVACYRIDIEAITDTSDKTVRNVGRHPSCSNHTVALNWLLDERGNRFTQLFTCNIPRAFANIKDAFINRGIVVDDVKLNKYLNDISLYTLVCERSEVWQTKMDEEIRPLIQQLASPTTNMNTHSNEYVALRNTIRRLESWTVPLDTYREIYHDLKASFTQNTVNELCRENLNLMLSDLMELMRRDKHLLNTFTPKPNTQVDPFYNKEQRLAITSTDPLTLLQSTAGSGKTSVIMGRIKYMVDAGVKPEDIAVISFTNAAADHIKELNPNVRSMTIDTMITSIYSCNFPNQDITTPMTLMNGLDVYFPHDPVAIDLRNALRSVNLQNEGAFTRLNRFVEDNLKHVQYMLETIQQVTLDLAIVICYQLIDSLKEPDEIQSKHLIIDEVQDTSIFQFIYALKYTHKHRESLYFVGDSSQTLFEFRFANPRALNVMESSGVFKTYKLETNHRSCQEVLDLANTVLSDIEANQYAKLRLRSDDLTPVDMTTFQERVQLQYVHLKTLSELHQNMDNYMRIYLMPYINDCLARGEKVTFLAFKREDIQSLSEALAKAYPGKKIYNISPKRPYEVTVLSNFVKRYWNDVRFLNKSNIVREAKILIKKHMSGLVSARGAKSTQLMTATSDFLDKWETSATPLMRAKFAELRAGGITQDQFFDELKRHMFAFESSTNIRQQQILSQQNTANKLSDEAKNADFLMSTIHSAKGLEWDNVVILYQDSNPMPEPTKRMYYVALTRAQKSEFILAYERTKSSVIESQYNAILAQLNAANVNI